MIFGRRGMTMIELIFAIVIISISVITIPTMMSVANNASKVVSIDEDVMSRLYGWAMDKLQARWDGNYSASRSGPLPMNPDTGDLNCSRIGGYRWGSDENVSSMQCNMAMFNLWDTAIPTVAGSGAGQADGNLSKGIEMLNAGSETITITPANGTPYDVNATYAVDYVSSSVTPLTGSNTQSATWVLGSSTNMNPSSAGTTTHLKRVVIRFNNPNLSTDTVLTFFKSNKGN
jgi:prepilin-type N-terminal cleavage/methylation domain-containing protein